MKKIKNLEDLQAEKIRLLERRIVQERVLRDDLKFVKKEYLSAELLNKAGASIVPAAIRHSKYLNAPINFIARRIFRSKEEVVSQKDDAGKGNRIRNVALAAAESLAPMLLGGFLKKKFKL